MLKLISYLFFIFFIYYFVNANNTQIVLQLGHTGPVNCIDFSPDGKYLATAGGDQSIKIWDVETGLLIRTLTGHLNEITDIRFSNSGDTLLTTSKDKTIKLWDANKGKLLSNYCCSHLIYTSVDFHPQSRIFVASGYDSEISIWDIYDNTKPIRKYSAEAPVTKVRFSKDGKFFYTSDINGKLNVYTIENPERIYKSLVHNGNSITGFDYAGESNLIAAKCDNDSIYVWDMTKFELLRTFYSTSEGISLSDNGIYLPIIEKNNNELIIKNVIANKNEFYLFCEKSDLISFKFSKSHSIFAAGFRNGKVLFWNVGKSKMYLELSGKNEPINAMAYSPISNTLATIIDKNTLSIWQIDKENTYRTYQTDMEIIYDIAFDESGNNVILVGYGFRGGISIINLINKSNQFLPNSNEQYISCDYLIKDKLILAATIDSFFIFNGISFEKVTSLKATTGIIHSAKFLQNSGKIVFLDGTSKIWLYDLTDNNFKFINNPSNKEILSFAISSDGEYILAGTEDGIIITINSKYFKIEKLLNNILPKSSIISICESYDSKYLAIGRSDNTITILDWKKHKELFNFESSHINIVQFLNFHHNSKFLFSGSTDGLVKVWNLDNNRQEALLFGMINNDWSIVSNRAKYDGTPTAMKKLHWVIDNKPSTLTTNFDDMYQPGLVNLLFSESIEQNDYLDNSPKAIAGFKSPPKILMLEPKDYDTLSSSNVEIKFRIFQGTYGLSYVSIFHNNKVIYSKKISYQNNNEFNGSRNILLLPGENIITIKVLDLENFESSYTTKVFRISSEKLKPPTLHILSIGLSEYANKKVNLNYAKKDAESILEELYKKNRSIVSSIKKYCFTNSQATKENIYKALNYIANNANSNDIFILYYAGHGITLNLDDKKVFFCLTLFKAFEPNNIMNIDTTELISTDQLASFLENIKAKKQMVIIDACNSAKAIEIFDINKDLSLLAIKTGISVLSATANVSAYETHDLEHGAFTYTLLLGINGEAKRKDNKITVSSLKAYIDYKLPIISRQYLPEEQVPFSWVSGVDFVIGEVE